MQPRYKFSARNPFEEDADESATAYSYTPAPSSSATPPIVSYQQQQEQRTVNTRSNIFFGSDTAATPQWQQHRQPPQNKTNMNPTNNNNTAGRQGSDAFDHFFSTHQPQHHQQVSQSGGTPTDGNGNYPQNINASSRLAGGSSVATMVGPVVGVGASNAFSPNLSSFYDKTPTFTPINALGIRYRTSKQANQQEITSADRLIDFRTPLQPPPPKNPSTGEVEVLIDLSAVKKALLQSQLPSDGGYCKGVRPTLVSSSSSSSAASATASSSLLAPPIQKYWIRPVKGLRFVEYDMEVSPSSSSSSSSPSELRFDVLRGTVIGFFGNAASAPSSSSGPSPSPPSADFLTPTPNQCVIWLPRGETVCSVLDLYHSRQLTAIRCKHCQAIVAQDESSYHLASAHPERAAAKANGGSAAGGAGGGEEKLSESAAAPPSSTPPPGQYAGMANAPPNPPTPFQQQQQQPRGNYDPFASQPPLPIPSYAKQGTAPVFAQHHALNAGNENNNNTTNGMLMGGGQIGGSTAAPCSYNQPSTTATASYFPSISPPSSSSPQPQYVVAGSVVGGNYNNNAYYGNTTSNNNVNVSNSNNYPSSYPPPQQQQQAQPMAFGGGFPVMGTPVSSGNNNSNVNNNNNNNNNNGAVPFGATQGSTYTGGSNSSNSHHFFGSPTEAASASASNTIQPMVRDYRIQKTFCSSSGGATMASRRSAEVFGKDYHRFQTLIRSHKLGEGAQGTVSLCEINAAGGGGGGGGGVNGSSTTFLVVKDLEFTTREEAVACFKQSATFAGLRHPHLIAYLAGEWGTQSTETVAPPQSFQQNLYSYFPAIARGGAAAAEASPQPPTSSVFYVSILMPYYPDGDIARLINRNYTFAPLHISSIGIQVATALAYLHAQPTRIVHRDVKPANILLYSNKEQCVLMDLDAAKEMGGGGGSSVFNRGGGGGGGFMFDTFQSASATSRGGGGGGAEAAEGVGTVEWMSPEAAEGKAVTPQTDVWSLGLVLFAMAVMPDFMMFRNPSTKEELMLNAAEWNASDLRRTLSDELYRKGCPQPLVDVILRMVVLDPRVRLTALQVGDELQKASEAMLLAGLT